MSGASDHGAVIIVRCEGRWVWTRCAQDGIESAVSVRRFRTAWRARRDAKRFNGAGLPLFQVAGTRPVLRRAAPDRAEPGGTRTSPPGSGAPAA
jgi:hypothetical protein